MSRMTMRERILALIHGREVDRVPFVAYDILVPPLAELYQVLPPGSVGLLRWCAIFREEHPNCRFETEVYYEDGVRWHRRWLHTPVGLLHEKKAFQPDLEVGEGDQAGIVRKHYIQQPEDYEVLWYYLQDTVILDNYGQYHSDDAELGADGLPLPFVERTPWQQLWIQWISLEDLSLHLIDYPDRLARTVDLLQQRARKVFEVAYRSPAPYINFPDNITAPTIGTQRFREYCVPLYDELAAMMAERDAPVFSHMDGNLKPLWQDIAACKVLGLDSFTPVPDCDTTAAEAVALWPEKRIWLNFPSSVHVTSPEQIRTTADAILADAGHSGRLQIQISEDVPPGVWRTSFPIIVDAIEAFGSP